MRLSLIIPAYNEENRIKETLDAYIEKLHELGINFEIIVEMDGCTDRTSEVVKEMATKFPEIKFIEFKERLGKSGGLLKGFEIANGDVVGFVDADGSVKPQDFIKLLREIEKGYDGAIASRRAKGLKFLVRPSSGILLE